MWKEGCVSWKCIIGDSRNEEEKMVALVGTDGGDFVASDDSASQGQDQQEDCKDPGRQDSPVEGHWNKEEGEMVKLQEVSCNGHQ